MCVPVVNWFYLELPRSCQMKSQHELRAGLFNVCISPPILKLTLVYRVVPYLSMQAFRGKKL